mgnify:CR=1
MKTVALYNTLLNRYCRANKFLIGKGESGLKAGTKLTDNECVRADIVVIGLC